MRSLVVAMTTDWFAKRFKLKGPGDPRMGEFRTSCPPPCNLKFRGEDARLPFERHKNRCGAYMKWASRNIPNVYSKCDVCTVISNFYKICNKCGGIGYRRAPHPIFRK